MLKVYKYPVETDDTTVVVLPKGAQVLHVNEQHGKFFMWALVNPANIPEERIFRFAGTGHPIRFASEELRYINTFFVDEKSLVFHFFEVVPKA